MRRDSPFLVRLVARLLPPDAHHLAGDLEEDYRDRVMESGLGRARIHLLSQVIRSFPLFCAEAFKWSMLMLGHYLKTGIRVIRRSPVYSLINVTSLAAGMAVALLIILFILDQRSYDRFHDAPDEIYRVNTLYQPPIEDVPDWYATSPEGLDRLIAESVPGVEAVVGIWTGFHGEIRQGSDVHSVQGMYAPPGFLDLFGYTQVSGSPTDALVNPGSMLLSTDAADRIFGPGVDPTGSSLTVLGDREYTVAGLLKSERRSHLQFDVVVSMSTLGGAVDGTGDAVSWRESLNGTYTYVRADGQARDRLNSVLAQMPEARFTDPSGETRLHAFRLQPITHINLGAELANAPGMVLPAPIGWFLAAFAAILMIVAGFNYVSLTVARSINRSREIGVRRVMGAARRSVFNQFLLESVLMSVLALVFAFGLMNVLLPRFNALSLVNLTDSRIGLDIYSDARVYLLFFGFSIVAGVLAGLYPARMFTTFAPVHALSDQRSSGRMTRQTVRKLITVGQFTFAIVFVITSIALVGQFRYMSRVDYGFDAEHVINIALQDVSYERLRTIVADGPGVVTTAASSKVPALGSISSVRIRNVSAETEILAHEFDVDADYIDAMGLSLTAGRTFNPGLSSDSANAAIVSRSAILALDLDTPDAALDALLEIEDTQYRIIGVIEDFISNNPAVSGDPIILRYRPDAFRYAIVKTAPGSLPAVLTYLRERWHETGSEYSPQVRVFDDQLQSSDVLLIFSDFLRVFGVIAGFTLFVSCLGLLGLAMYSARNRVREIGIRKMLGASRGSLVVLLTREYLVLIGAAVMLGAPLAWLLNSFWLSRLSNSFELGPGIFAVAIGLTAVAALGAVASQTIRAARGSVADTLRF